MNINKYNNNIKEDNKLTKIIKYHIGTIIWYIVFILIIPISIRNVYGFDKLRYYFPIVDLIANSFSFSGKNSKMFRDLYKLSPNNIISFLSTNFINLLALMGVSWNGMIYFKKYKDLWMSIRITLIMYVVTYLIPTQIIPLFIGMFQKEFDEEFGWKLHVMFFGKMVHLEDYIAGIILIIILMFIEIILITLYIKKLK